MNFLNHTFAYEDLRDCTLITKNGAKIVVNIDSIEFSGDGFSKFEGHTMGVKTTEPRLSYTDYSRYYKTATTNYIPEIKNVIFNDPATIVFWEDGTKTVVKCQSGDSFDPEKGLAMAITKKAYGNKGSYCNQLKKWLHKSKKQKPKNKMTFREEEAKKHLLDIRVEKLKKENNKIKLENYEVELEEKYISEEYETTILFFRGPKEMVIKDYPEAESTEISIEFPTSTPHSEYATVKIYYTKDGLYYDLCDKEFTDDDVEKLIAYGIEKGEQKKC